MQFVAIDLETTGIDPKADAVTEIAAVRFDENGIIERYQQLVNPNRPIPEAVRLLTHIDYEMVRDKPFFRDVVDDVAEFIGDDIIVGHNVNFDLTFLKQGGILRKCRSYDTFDLASILMPTCPRYKLGALAEQLNVDLTQAHRALADAETTALIFNKLVEMIYDLPYGLLATLVKAGKSAGASCAEVFSSVLSERTKRGERAMAGSSGFTFPRFYSKWDTDETLLKPAETPEPLDADEMAAILDEGGAFSRQFSRFEPRPQQLEMLRSVSDAFSNGHHMLIEAGTGTGKSFAYLIPAFHWAIKNGERVVISTNTINLQDQLMDKDIPELERALGIELRATVQKGRGNYFCPYRLNSLIKRGASSPDEYRVLCKLLIWLSNGGQGDRAEINLNAYQDREIWNRLSAENEGCRPTACNARREGKCPFYTIKEQAQHSHVVIVNHALLLADAVYAKGVLPEYKYLVIDEGHHLESAATGAMSYRTSQTDISRMLQDYGSTSNGMLGRLLTALQDQVTEETYNDYKERVENIVPFSEESQVLLKELFGFISAYMEDIREGHPLSNYGQQIRITEEARLRSGWSDIENAWFNLEEQLSCLQEGADHLQKRIESLDDLDDSAMELLGLFTGMNQNLAETHDQLEQLFLKPLGNSIYWIDIGFGNRISLCIAPLEVGPMIQQNLWFEKESIILTSATLAANKSFDYMRSRLCADEADDFSVGSPFDYKHNVLLCLPKDIPDPNQYNAQLALENTLKNLCRTVGGRTLVLFTSYAQLRKTSAAIQQPLKEAGITVFEQGEGISSTALLDTFRHTEKAVLLGTRSFWEGVDIQGEMLSVVVIAKLPFDVPSDPIFAARSECFENSFAQYSLPEAILKFRQGFGRLIRSKTDRGLVVVMDNRLTTKRYGQEFLNSIPECTRFTGSVKDLSAAAKKWLNLS